MGRTGVASEGENFNPRSPCGERRYLCTQSAWSSYFNPRSPCGERLLFQPMFSSQPVFQSTLPVWGATARIGEQPVYNYISIHAPRVGSDHYAHSFFWLDFYFNPRSPCGERPYSLIWNDFFRDISIHAPRVGSDHCLRRQNRIAFYFNPRSPCGERLDNSVLKVLHAFISIHAPRVGSDSYLAALEGVHGYFNPRSPCGERLDSYCAD